VIYLPVIYGVSYPMTIPMNFWRDGTMTRTIPMIILFSQKSEKAASFRRKTHSSKDIASLKTKLPLENFCHIDTDIRLKSEFFFKAESQEPKHL
jgi:hypothetical protein